MDDHQLSKNSKVICRAGLESQSVGRQGRTSYHETSEISRGKYELLKVGTGKLRFSPPACVYAFLR